MSSPVVLITGGAQRIGAALVRRFHAGGFRVCIHYQQSADAAQALAEDLNQQRSDSAFLFRAELSDIAAIERMAENVLDEAGKLDVLVNNASGFKPTPLGKVTEQDWDALFASNAKGGFFLSQALAPALAASGGSIINVLDIHASRPLQTYPVYCAAKAAAQMLTRALAMELAPGVRVNGIAPGAILWPGEDTLLDDNQEQARILERTPLGRLGSPGDIADTAWFLATGPDYVTGQILAIDGGRSLSM